jgi:hypothetical protein
MAIVKTDDQNYINIANAIRRKLAITDTFTPGEMDDAILQISGDNIDHEEIPQYVKKEALSVAQKVNAVLQNDSIVFIAGSDSHESTTAHVADGNIHAGMAMKSLAYILNLDFAAFLGDYTAGSATTTIAEGKEHFESINADIDEAFKGLPQFRTVGNHDPLGYSYTQNGVVLTQEELYSYIGKYNEDSGAVMGSETAGYCYRDFTTKNVRVICLNTADVANPTSSAETMTDEQKKWFADTLISTPSDYGIIILSHIPLDWGEIISVSHILRAYVEEQPSINIGGTSYSFTEKNKSAWVITFHGHVHGFRVDNLHWNNNGTGVAYDVKRIAIPNMCFVRNNEYGQNSGAEYYGIEFGESTTYAKTADSEKDTAFCVCVVNPSEQKVYAICYGAGYDREIYFGENVVSVTGITLSENSGTLNPNDSVTITATVAPANASNKTVLWTSSNNSVATVNNGVVTAVAVGTATITATTQDGGFTATYTLTVEAVKRGNMISVFGYSDGKRLSTGSGELKDASGYTTIGFIDLLEYADGDQIVIRVKGIDFTTPSGGYRDSAYVLYNASRTLAYSDYTKNAGDHTHGSVTVNIAHTYGTNGSVFTITGLSGAHTAGIYYLRLCGYGSGANIDLRVNEDFD